MKSENEKNHFFFELMVIDPADINNEMALAQGLCFSNALWNGSSPKIEKEKGYTRIKDENSGIQIVIKTIDTSNVLTSYFESAFVLNIFSDNFDRIEEVRIKILHHLKDTLKFNHIRLLTDDISTYIANKLYPEINKIENLLRRYLIKFFIQRVGFDWWEATANKAMIEKVKIRKSDKKDEISNLIDDEVRYVDFDDLGELIYKQSSGYNNPDKIVSRLLKIDNDQEFKNLKNELQSNYSKYFKENFQNKQFEQKWREIIKLRHKVAHHGIFYKHELVYGMDILASLSEIIKNAEKLIDDVVFSIEDKEAIRIAKIEANQEEANNIEGLKILGRMDLPNPENKYQNKYYDIEEYEMIEELQELERNKWSKFIGLKWFVTDYLANKNYAIASSFILINILIDKKIFEKYDIVTPNGYSIVAVRLSSEYKI